MRQIFFGSKVEVLKLLHNNQKEDTQKMMESTMSLMDSPML